MHLTQVRAWSCSPVGRGHLVTQNELLTNVWGPGYEGRGDYLRTVLPVGIRRKLEDDPSAPRHFIAEPGVGYRFTA